MIAQVGTRTFSLALNGWPPARIARVVPSVPFWSTRSVKYGARVITGPQRVYLAAVALALAQEVNSLRRSVRRTLTTATALRTMLSATQSGTPARESA
jgi:hypothetical protein